MIHPDLNHPSKLLDKQVLISVIAPEGIQFETVMFRQIQWDSLDEKSDTINVLPSNPADALLTAVYSTMELPERAVSS